MAKRLLLVIITCLILLPSAGYAADDVYGYPFANSFDSTILGTPGPLKATPPEKMSVTELVVDVIPGLERPDVFFYDEGLRSIFAYQDKKAPFIFLIAGTGANHHAEKVLAMMKQFYKAGYHVATLPSPTHPNFIISASQSHVPGDLTDDAADLYKAMEVIWSKVKDDIEVSDFSVGGYSLGGTQAAFVAKLDEEKKIFNFRKVLMVNPAVNLLNSVTRIEELLEKIPGGPRKIGAFFNQVYSKFVTYYRRGDYVEFDSEFLYSAYRARLVSPEEAGGLIGLSFRISLAGMIFDSDVMTNGGYVVPKNRVLTSSDSLADYFRVAVHLSFLNYFEEYFYPYFQKKRPGLVRGQFIRSLGLQSIEDYLKVSPKFVVMTNENDLILTPSELQYLRTLFGERIKIYAIGGHCGNLEYRDNVAYMVEHMGVAK